MRRLLFLVLLCVFTSNVSANILKSTNWDVHWKFWEVQSRIVQNEKQIEANKNKISVIETTVNKIQIAGSSDPANPFKYATYANGRLVGQSKITVDYSNPNTDVILRFSNVFYEIRLDKTGVLKHNYSTLQRRYYVSQGCIGRAYLALNFDGQFVFKKFKGILLIQNNNIFYSPPNAPIFPSLNIKSHSDLPGQCTDQDIFISGYSYIEVFPNDPNITGIDVYPFPLPITFDGVEIK